MVHFVFRCQLRDAAAIPHPDGDEITGCAYWPPEALPYPISDFTVRRIQDALAGPGLPLPVTISPRRWLE
jgi:hypothetical protein